MFDSGVYGYLWTEAKIMVPFPVNHKGEPDVRCYQCRYYRMTSRRCGLTDDLLYYPDKFVGDRCPLIPTNNDKENES